MNHFARDLDRPVSSHEVADQYLDAEPDCVPCMLTSAHGPAFAPAPPLASLAPLLGQGNPDFRSAELRLLIAIGQGMRVHT